MAKSKAMIEREKAIRRADFASQDVLDQEMLGYHHPLATGETDSFRFTWSVFGGKTSGDKNRDPFREDRLRRNLPVVIGKPCN